MPQYKEGLARALSAAPNRIELVGGTTTNQILVGDLFRFQADAAPAWYVVGNVLSDSIFELTGNYVGAQAFDSLLPYLVCRDFTPNLGLAELAPGDIAIREVFTQDMRILDGLLTRLLRAEFSFVGAITAGDKPLRWYNPFPVMTRSVHAALGTAPSGSPLIVNIKRSGVSLFSGNGPTVISGQFSNEVALSAQLGIGDFLTVEIVQGGGSDLVVQVRF